jgi:hypothetical protein
LASNSNEMLALRADLRSWRPSFRGLSSADSLTEKSEPPNAARETFSLGTARILRRIVSATSDHAEEAKNTPDFAPNLTRQNDKKLFHINMLKCGWGARIRTWDHGTKTRCLTAWPRPNSARVDEQARPAASIYIWRAAALLPVSEARSNVCGPSSQVVWSQPALLRGPAEASIYVTLQPSGV